ncbi:MAG: helix-turn-helix transcriptional regulator [Chitinophagaceae bacterium]|nr:helix-turn-helix transcriptional regulator [Chitinophagaceae bacterium]
MTKVRPFSCIAFFPINTNGKKPPTSGYPWDPQTLWEKILKRRLDLGLSQIEVAQMLNLDLQTISRWECGTPAPKTKPYPHNIKFLAYYPFPVDESEKTGLHDIGIKME